MNNNKHIGVIQALKLFFGFFMVLVYLGMAVLVATNYYHWWPGTTMWTAVRWFFASILGAYGIYRAYREIKGQHTYGMKVDEEEEEKEKDDIADLYNRLKENEKNK